MIQINSFFQPMHMAEHLRGLRTTNDASDKLDGEIEIKQSSNKRDQTATSNRAKTKSPTKRSELEKRRKSCLPSKKKLDTFTKNHGQNNILSNLKIKELLKVDNHNNLVDTLGVNQKVRMHWACFGVFPRQQRS